MKGRLEDLSGIARGRWTVCGLLAVVTLLLYLPVGHYEFLEYDDPAYVNENPAVSAGLTWAGIKWAFTTTHASDWQPLAFLSHMLDCQLFGSDAGKHHLVNVLLHAMNAVLVFLLILRLTNALGQSALVAALFAWHPLRVESVAWVAERKGLLCAFFGLLALVMYARYAQKSKRCQMSGVKTWTLDLGPWTLDYALALLFFGLGLMSKPALVALPSIFLLLDYWPLQRASGLKFRVSDWRRLALEKWPFFALTAASCVVTLLAMHRHHSLAPLAADPFPLRIENAAVSCAAYVGETFWPANLTIARLMPKEIPWLQAAAATLLLGAISWVAWRVRRRKPYLLTGWLWYLGMLVPVIGLVQQGLQAMADRYTYLPQIGVFVGLAFAAGDLASRLRLKAVVLFPAAIVVLAGYSMATTRQLRLWQDSETLFAHALAVTKDNYIACFNFGVALYDKGRVDEAIHWFQKALEIQPNYAEAHNNLAVALMNGGQTVEAVTHLRQAVRIQPDYAEAHCNLGNALLRLGQVEAAIVHYQNALDLQPGLARVHNNLGTALLQEGQADAAIAQFRECLRMDRVFVPAYNNLAGALLRQGRVDEAIVQYRKAAELQPDSVDARARLADALLHKKLSNAVVAQPPTTSPTNAAPGQRREGTPRAE